MGILLVEYTLLVKEVQGFTVMLKKRDKEASIFLWEVVDMILLALLIEILTADVDVQQASDKNEMQVAENEKTMHDPNYSSIVRNVCSFVDLFPFFMFWGHIIAFSPGST